MRSSKRVMCFPAGTMVAVKGYPFLLRDDVAVMGAPENFGAAMCELAKAEQMEDQALAAGGDCVAYVGEQERLTQVKKELAEDVHLLVNTGNISKNDMFVIACGYRLRGKKIEDMRAKITQLEAKVAELSRNQVGSVGDVKMTVTLTPEAIEAAKELFPANGEIVATPDYMVPTWSNDAVPSGDEISDRKVFCQGDLAVRDSGLLMGHRYTVTSNSLKGHLPDVIFQEGPVPQNGVNGLTNEALLAILIHRTKILDERFPCNENSEAIALMTKAKHVFESRTKRRQAVGIEGKMVEQA